MHTDKQPRTIESGLRVLVVDDHSLVRSGIIGLLEAADIEVVGEASNGREALEVAERLHPEVVLMDIRMPVMDGIEATSAMTRLSPPPKVLVLTTFDLDEYVYRALEAGAARPERLVDAVRTVAAGDSLLAPEITKRLIERYLVVPQQASLPSDLTPRELEVWLLLARGLSNAEIGRELYLTEATVKAHVTRLLAKLGLRDRVQAVVAAYETGAVLPGRPRESTP